ncbi:MAG TPA: prepilin peptidase [Solirubrobacteraceae bacterium]|jgi:leader peptidase (prepilin peptidase)/N-methyltransferase|nr:prepilin peptidase [Solirubrobacteraceae bacterium]
MILGIVVAALGGCLAGSLGVLVAQRLSGDAPARTGGPRCGHCAHAIRRGDLIPVVSWLALRGRCRDCAAPIARRHVVVEAGTGIVFVAVAATAGGTDLVLGLVLVAALVPLVLIDLDTRRLPNAITLAAAVAAIVLGTLLDPGGEPGRLLAGVLGGAFLLLAALAFPRGMGLGDVKLAAVLGLFLGRAVAAALLVALVAGVLAGIVVIARKGAADGRRTAIAFGPLLALGGACALLFGNALVDAYLATF